MPKSTIDPIEPTPQDVIKAAKAFCMFSEGHLDVSELPEIVIRMISMILDQTAQGRALVIESFEADLTTTKAADYLNVSRPYLVKLLDEGKIVFHHVGAHRRIAFRDLKVYKESQKERSYAALAELQAQSQELNMGY